MSCSINLIPPVILEMENHLQSLGSTMPEILSSDKPFLK